MDNDTHDRPETEQHAGSPARGLVLALTIFLAARALVFAVAYTAPQHRDRPDAPSWWSHQPLVRWDSGYYYEILARGYAAGPPVPGTVAFFPAYSLVTWPLAQWMDPHTALVVVANVASFLGVVFLYLWARRRAGTAAATWCTVLLAAYPAAFFLSAAYADALLFFLVAMIAWLLDRRWLIAAAIVCGVATATRPTGLAVAAVVFAWAVAAAVREKRLVRSIPRLMLIGMVSISGFVAYQSYLWHVYGMPDAFFKGQASWEPKSRPQHRWLRAVTLQPVINTSVLPAKFAVRGQFHMLERPATWNPLLNTVLVAIGVAGLFRPNNIPRVLFLLPILVFLMAYAADPAAGTRLVGIARYQLIALPSFLLAGIWVSRGRAGPWVAVPLAAAMLVLQCVCIRGFVDWQMVG